jgi:dTDP-4-dehydrorhamnose reductase
MNKIKFPEGTLVLGGSGMTGYYIDDSVPNFDKSNGYDLTKKGVLTDIFEQQKPKVVLLLAALTDVVKIEEDPASCFDLNTRVAYETAYLCKKWKADLYFISSVDVFDGQKTDDKGNLAPYELTDIPSPIITYGHSKLAAEGAIRAILPEAVILRASWMFGGFDRDKKFISYVVKALKKGETFKAVDDRFGSPTYGRHLVETIRKMVVEDYPKGKTYHVCCKGKCSRYDQAVVVADEWGSGNIERAKYNDIPGYRSLLNATMIPSPGLDAPTWEEALRDYVREWKKIENV